jgi:hypothetical protein
MPIITLAEFVQRDGRVLFVMWSLMIFSALMEYKDLSSRVPPSNSKKLTKLGGDGGIVVIDKRAHQYGVNTAVMYRPSINTKGK